MPVVLEAIIVSAIMLLIFGVAFVAIFLLALSMAPVERSLSKMVWDITNPPVKRPLPPPQKGGFKDFSSKH